MAKILFIQQSMFPLQVIAYISSLVKKHGHESKAFVHSAEKDMIELIKKENPDIIGIPFVTQERLWAFELSTEIKKNFNVPIMFGGADVTFYPEIISHKDVDLVVVGEGEFAVLEILNSIRDAGKIRTDIQNVHIKKDGKVIKNPARDTLQNLDILPFPDYSIYDKYPVIMRDKIKRFMLSRGCVFACTFCYNFPLKKEFGKKGALKTRRHSPKYAIDMIKDFLSRYDAEIIEFSDDCFIDNKEWLKEFLPLFKREINKTFTCLIIIRYLDEEIAKMLKEAGCKMVSFGIESGDEEYRMGVLNKPVRDTDIIKGAAILKKYKITFITYNMFNFPNETLEIAMKAVELNRKIKTDCPWSSIAQPFPKTRMLDEYMKINNLPKEYPLTEEYVKRISFHETSMIDGRDSDKIKNLHKFFYLMVKFPFLIPLIRVLIKFKPNRLYDLIFLGTFSIRYAKAYDFSLFYVIRQNLNYLKYYFKDV